MKYKNIFSNEELTSLEKELLEKPFEDISNFSFAPISDDDKDYSSALEQIEALEENRLIT